MTALAADRRTPVRADNDIHSFGVKANAKIFAGALVALNGGYAAPGATATGRVAVGRAEHYVDAAGAADGDLQVKVRAGIFQFANSASGDLIAITEIGSDCYIVDDQTVAKTSATNTRSIAGKVMGVDAQGVWVAIGPGGVI